MGVRLRFTHLVWLSVEAGRQPETDLADRVPPGLPAAGARHECDVPLL